MTDMNSLLGPSRDKTARGDIAIHDHVCGIYDSHEQQYGPACEFIKIGLARNEQCLYITEHLTVAEFMGLLDAHGVDAKGATLKGALLVKSGHDIRGLLGGFTPDAMLSFLGGAEQEALGSGFSALRLAADMTWLADANIEPAEMFSYEARLNQLLFARNITGLCQYARDDFKAELLIAAAETHPLLVYNEIVCDNFYFVPPEEYLKPGFSDIQLERILFNIVSRERLMQNFLT